jgi:tetratricopeptide (TPR) repeat protein
MRKKQMAIAAVVLLVAAAAVGGWFYVQPKVVSVWVYTDYAFRFKHADWAALLDSRFNEVNRIYESNHTGVRWKVLDASQTDPTSALSSMDSRRATMTLHMDRPTDVYVIVTGIQEGARTGSVSPFTRVAVVVDFPDKSEALNARSLAHELAHLFGAPQDPGWTKTLMEDKPEGARFSDATIALIRRMRGYPFALGIDGLARDSWEKKALAAVAHDDAVVHGNGLAHAHSVVGTALLSERKNDAAMEQFRLAVQADPQNKIAHLNLAEAYSRNGREDLAIEQCRETVRLAPDDPVAHRALGALLGRTRQPEEAVQEMQIAARLEPNNVDTRVLLGLEQAGMFGHLDEAIATIEEAMKLDPAAPGARDALEKIQALKQAVAEEVARQRALVQANPNDPDANYRLGKAEARAGDLKGAIRDFQKSADLRPASGTPHSEMAELYLLSGDGGRAWAEVRKARQLGTEPPASLIARLPAER